MRYNVAQLLKEPTGATRTVELSRSQEKDGDFGGAAAGCLQLLRTHQGVLVRGSVAVPVAATCGRCLKEFTERAFLEVEEEFFPLLDVNTGLRRSLPEDAEAETIDNNHILDLTEVLRQNVIAAQPIKPLCRLNCPGLCPGCGADLSSESCACKQSLADPRWGSLVALLQET